MSRVDFEFVGRYKSTWDDGGYTIAIGERPPFLNNNLVPTELESSKPIDRDDWIDLDSGYDHFDYENRNEKLETILDFISQLHLEEKNLRKRIGSDFVCHRDLIKDIALLMNSDRALKFHAVRLKDVIFMFAVWEIDEKHSDRFKERYYRVHNFESKIRDTDTPPGEIRKITNKVVYRKVNRITVKSMDQQNSITILSPTDVDASDTDPNNPEAEPTDVEAFFIKGVCDAHYHRNASHIRFLQAKFGNCQRLVIGHTNDDKFILKKTCPNVRFSANYFTLQLNGNNECVVVDRLYGEEASHHYCYEIQKTSCDRPIDDITASRVNMNIEVVYSVFQKLKKCLSENGKAVKFQKREGQKLNSVEDFKFISIRAGMFDFVSEEFLNQFE